MGRKKAYKTARELGKGIDTYWRSISYERPVVVSTPTGEVDGNGNIRYTTRMLLLDEDGAVSATGVGRPMTETEFLKEPSVAGLCLHLGISKQTWSAYKADEGLRAECERFLLRLEDHLAGKLDGSKSKSVQGVIFNLEHNFGWRERREVEHTWDDKPLAHLDLSAMSDEQLRAMAAREPEGAGEK